MVTPDPEAVLDGLRDHKFCSLDGGARRESMRQPGGDGGRVGTARAVGGDALDERCRQDGFPAPVPENVHGLRDGT